MWWVIVSRHGWIIDWFPLYRNAVHAAMYYPGCTLEEMSDGELDTALWLEGWYDEW